MKVNDMHKSCTLMTAELIKHLALTKYRCKPKRIVYENKNINMYIYVTYYVGKNMDAGNVCYKYNGVQAEEYICINYTIYSRYNIFVGPITHDIVILL